MKLNTFNKYQFYVDVYAYIEERQESGQVLRYYYLLESAECDARPIKPLGIVRVRTKKRYDTTYHMRNVRDKNTEQPLFLADLGVMQNYAIINAVPIANPLGEVEEWEYVLRPEATGFSA